MSNTQSPILVVGATGNVGRHLVPVLLGKGVPVRALSHRSDVANITDGADAVYGDLSRPETLSEALDGVKTIFLVWPFITVDKAQKILSLMKERGVERVVYLSSAGVNDEAVSQDNPIDQLHADMEALIKRSGLSWSILRASGMATNTLNWAQSIRDEGAVRWFQGEARRSLIDERDIAAVVAEVLLKTGHDKAVYPITGPEAYSQLDMVQIIGEVIGKPLRWEEVPEAVIAEAMSSMLPVLVVDGIIRVHQEFAETPEVVTDMVRQITGNAARPFSAWVEYHADDFL